MSTKVKGLLKGLRYISQIFEEKDDDIQIGFPTDVKHVAHIGSDDPSANAPSWMSDFKAPKEGTTNATEKPEEHNNNSKDAPPSKTRHMIPKSRHQSIDTEANKEKKHTRRHHRTSDPSGDYPVHDSSSGGSRHRRHRRGSNHDSEEVPPTGNKHSHRRKSKNSEDGGSVRKPSSRRSSKGDSLTEISLSDFGSGESAPGLVQ